MDTVTRKWMEDKIEECSQQESSRFIDYKLHYAKYQHYKSLGDFRKAGAELYVALRNKCKSTRNGVVKNSLKVTNGGVGVRIFPKEIERVVEVNKTREEQP